MFLGAKRLECAELAPAFRAHPLNDSASKLDAVQTLCATEMPALPNGTVISAAHAWPSGAYSSSRSGHSSMIRTRTKPGKGSREPLVHIVILDALNVLLHAARVTLLLALSGLFTRS